MLSVRVEPDTSMKVAVVGAARLLLAVAHGTRDIAKTGFRRTKTQLQLALQ